MSILWGYQWDLPGQKISKWHASRFPKGYVVLCGRYAPNLRWIEKWRRVIKDYEKSELCIHCVNCVRRIENDTT